MKQEQLKKYAELIARKGLNVSEGQDVFIQAGLDQPEFVTLVAEECYKAGASSVYTNFSYQPLAKLNSHYRPLEAMSRLTPWAKAEWQYKAENFSCRLFIESDDPDGMKGADQEKLTAAQRAMYPEIKPFREAIENKHQWCIAAAPGKAWAKKIFPDLSEEEAEEKMWDIILLASRADGDDPVDTWEKHNASLAARCEYLNGLGLKALEYKSSNGTDFTVGLLENGIFCGGSEKTLQKREFNPNIPTEEVFTAPHAGVAEGIVYASKPLSYRGQLIENFSLRFENGKVTEAKAEKGEELLKQMVSMDEGASMLGEVALIPFDSPINKTGVLFYNTLFDENASCHFALGRGYNECLKGFEKLSSDEIKTCGVNDSMIHVDFMIGTKDLSIVGVTKTGERVRIFKDGNWAF